MKAERAEPQGGTGGGAGGSRRAAGSRQRGSSLCEAEPLFSPSHAVWRATLRLLAPSVPHPQRGVRHTGHQLVQLHQPLEQEDLLHHRATQGPSVSAPRPWLLLGPASCPQCEALFTELGGARGGKPAGCSRGAAGRKQGPAEVCSTSRNRPRTSRRGPLNEDVFTQPCAEEQALLPSVQELTEQIHRLLLQVGAPRGQPAPGGSFSHAAPSPGSRPPDVSPPCTLVPVLSSTVPGPASRAHLPRAQCGAAPALHLGSVCLTCSSQLTAEG